MNEERMTALTCGSGPVSFSDRRIFLIAVTGGIGSGKSVVCRILKAMGYPVYDCDSRARKLMDESEEILAAIVDCVSSEAVGIDDAGRRRLDRKVLADVVFNDRMKLDRLNAIVHGEVRNDIRRWCLANIEDKGRCAKGGSADGSGHVLMFVESAIVLESGLHNMVDMIWHVTAPESLRLARAMRRDTASEEQIRARMRHQTLFPSDVADESGRQLPVMEIVNDDTRPVLMQIERLLEECR